MLTFSALIKVLTTYVRFKKLPVLPNGYLNRFHKDTSDDHEMNTPHSAIQSNLRD